MFNDRDRRKSYILAFCCVVVAGLLSTGTAPAQTTQFTYQGKLTDNGASINALYDFTLTLWDAPTNGNQIGSTLTVQNTAIVDGIFTVTLDFGAGAFNGASRFLEITLKPTGNPAVLPTLPSPRQQVLSTPYAIKSLGSSSADGLSAACVNCITNTQIGSVNGNAIIGSINGSAISGQIPVASVPPGSGSYIQNATTQQASSNFNITGNGIVGGQLWGNIVNAVTQYDLSGNRILSNAGSGNIFVGLASGLVNSGGFNNSFLGFSAGRLNTTGNNNSFFGWESGDVNDIGNLNAFCGSNAGRANTTGSENSFFGAAAGLSNTTGSNNTMIGSSANVLSGNLINATAIGASAFVGQSNSLVLGSIAGINGAASDTRVGIGTTQPSERLTIKTATNNYGVIHTDGTVTVGSYVGGTGGQPVGGWIGTKSNHPLNFFVGNGGAAMTLETSGFLALNNVDAGGSLQLCLGPSNHISFCSSSLRYKTDVQSFLGGLDIVNRLRPITFTWKVGGMRDLGFGAEEGSGVEPLLTFRNAKGDIEGVKYSQINVVLVNAIKEQQTQIEQQRREIETIKQRQQELESLKKLVCADHPAEAMCNHD